MRALLHCYFLGWAGQPDSDQVWIELRPVAFGNFSRRGGKVCSVKVAFPAHKKKGGQCAFETLFLGLFLFLAGQPGSDQAWIELRPVACGNLFRSGGKVCSVKVAFLHTKI